MILSGREKGLLTFPPLDTGNTFSLGRDAASRRMWSTSTFAAIYVFGATVLCSRSARPRPGEKDFQFGPRFETSKGMCSKKMSKHSKETACKIITCCAPESSHRNKRSVAQNVLVPRGESIKNIEGTSNL